MDYAHIYTKEKHEEARSCATTVREAVLKKAKSLRSTKITENAHDKAKYPKGSIKEKLPGNMQNVTEAEDSGNTNCLSQAKEGHFKDLKQNSKFGTKAAIEMERSEIPEADHLITASTQIGSTNASKRKRRRKRAWQPKEAVECTQDPEAYEGIDIAGEKCWTESDNNKSFPQGNVTKEESSKTESNEESFSQGQVNETIEDTSSKQKKDYQTEEANQSEIWVSRFTEEELKIPHPATQEWCDIIQQDYEDWMKWKMERGMH